MKNNSTNFNEENMHEKPIDIKKIFFIVIKQWHWFLLFGILGFSGAYTYNKLTTPKYSVSTDILVPEKSKGMDMKNLFEGVFNQENTKIANQIDIVKSYFIINQTLSNLNWRTSWSKKNLLIWNGIYKQEPYLVQEPEGFLNPSGIKIYITPTSNESFNISADGKFTKNHQIVALKFEGHGAYDQPFKNNWFNFTLLEKTSDFEPSNEKYCFEFNNMNAMTLAYQKKLQVVQKDKNGDIITCTLEGEEPLKESEFLNELVNVFIKGKMDFQNESQRRSLDFINSQLTGISDSLKTAGTKYSEFRSKNKIIDLGAEGTMVMNNLKELESEGAKSQIQLDYFNNLLSYLSKKGDIKSFVSPSVVGIEDASLNSLVLKISELYNRRQVLSFSAREDNPTLVLLDQELGETRSRLNENLRNLIENATKSINSMKVRQDNISFQLNKLPQKEQQMVSIQRQFTMTNEIYTFLLQKRAETNIALASSIPDVQVIDIAREETATPIGLSGQKKLIIGFILGLGFPALFIVFINFIDDHIRSQEDVENNTNLPILGSIMHNPAKIELDVIKNPQSIIAESFRVLRTNLHFMLSGSNGNVIAIHSTNHGEGKSFNAINLASILSLNNKKVLLIGADMRKPRIHKIFGIENDHGLSSFLNGYNILEQVIHPTEVRNLSVLPSGPIPSNPAELLEKPEMKEMIEKVRSMYDYIVIDNAPISLVTDANIVSQWSDLNLFILRYGISHMDQLEIINQLADKKIIKHIGLIINDIKVNTFGSTYYKYYRYENSQNIYYATQSL